jgi:hydrogenase 3 maturation protease
MSNSSLSKPLRQALESLASKNKRPSRVAIIGIGNELNGDDGAGVIVARNLPKPGIQSNWLVIDAGPAPESFTGPLRKFQPDLVLFVDAAEMGEPAGASAWLEWQSTGGLSASTHSLPLTVVTKYLIHELACQVAMIGIQPQQLEMGSSLSNAVQKTVTEVAACLSEFITS